MFRKLEVVEERYRKLEQLLSDPAVLSNRAEYQKCIREHGEIGAIVGVYRQYKEVLEELEESRELLNDDDPDIKGMAKEEIESLSSKKR